MTENKILAIAQQQHQAGQVAAAEAGYRQVLAINPRNPAAIYGMAVLAYQTGRLSDAAVYAGRLADNQPNSVQAQFTLGSIRKAQGDLAGAVESLALAAAYDPGNVAVRCALGAAYRDQADFARAIEAYLAATRLQPADEGIWSHLANAHWGAERFEDATDAFRKAVALRPDHPRPYLNLSRALFEQGDYEAALECCRKALDIEPAPGALVQFRTMLPVILESEQQIDNVRNCLHHNLDAMAQEPLRIADPITEIGRANFFLAYHGRDDRALQTSIADVYRRICPSLTLSAAHCEHRAGRGGTGEIRIGFISKFFANHSIGRTSRGIIERLSRDRFKVVAIFLDPPADETAHAIARAADEVLVIGHDLDRARRAIAGNRLDILFYQDIGMDVFTYFLAFARLAPVQCASFGHPETTGISTIDYYVSTDLWEPEDGASHYSEKLMCLHDVGSVAYYYKPDLPDPLKPRGDFGLSEDAHLYICPQALFKFHPTFDHILGEILRRDPAGTVVLVDGKFRRWSELLRERFRRTHSRCRRPHPVPAAPA